MRLNNKRGKRVEGNHHKCRRRGPISFVLHKGRLEKLSLTNLLRWLHNLNRDVLRDNQQYKQDKICKSIGPTKGRMTILSNPRIRISPNAFFKVKQLKKYCNMHQTIN